MSINSASSSYDQYTIDPSVTIQRTERKRNQTIHTLSDGTQWVQLKDHGEERFRGYLYLNQALKNNDFVQAAENKMMLLKTGQIIYLSKYCGDQKPDNLEPALEQAYKGLKEKPGYTDTENYSNARIQDGKLYLFDTEKFSFSPAVHNKIGAMEKTRDAIEDYLRTTAKK